MSHLLDVNFLLACGWNSHAKHATARAWLEAQFVFTSRWRNHWVTVSVFLKRECALPLEPEDELAGGVRQLN